MKNKFRNEAGFALIVSMIILAALTILVVSSMRSTTLSEKMSGSYMDRTLAQQAAEQAMRQAEGKLVTDGEKCVAGCTIKNGAVSTAGVVAATSLPTAWSDTDATTITTATEQKTTAKYIVSLLDDTLFLPAGKTGCKAYSIMGRGTGVDTNSVVVLQTVAYVCPI